MEERLDTTGYFGHSFHIAAATATVRASHSDSLIKTLGQWESTVYLRYIVLLESVGQPSPDSWLVCHSLIHVACMFKILVLLMCFCVGIMGVYAICQKECNNL